MGRITQKIKVVNVADLVRFHDGTIPKEEIRQLEVEAIIDTGARRLVFRGENVVQHFRPEKLTVNPQSPYLPMADMY